MKVKRSAVPNSSPHGSVQRSVLLGMQKGTALALSLKTRFAICPHAACDCVAL